MLDIGFLMMEAWPLIDPEQAGRASFGGAELNLWNLAKAMAETGRTLVTFYVGDYGQPKEVEVAGVQVRRVRYFNYDPQSKYGQTWRYLLISEVALFFQLIRCRHQALITSCGGGLLGRLGLMKNLKRFKLVFRLAHDSDTDPGYLAETGEKLSNRLYLYGLRQTDVMVSQTRWQQERLKATMGFDSVVIGNGFQPPSALTCQKKSGLLWVGRAVGFKRPHLFVELAASLPAQKCVMILPGDEEMRERIKREAGGLTNLKVIDHVPFHQIQRYFEEARWFVNTSENEGFPNTFIQSAYAGTPILSMKVDPDEILQRNGFGLVADDKMERAVTMIEETDEDVWQSMSACARTYVAKHHDVREKAARYLELIEACMDKGGRGR